MKTDDLRGAARLATEATSALTDLVEAMHERIARVPGLGGVLDGRTGGITGLAYRSVRGTTRLVGGSVDALLRLVDAGLGNTATVPAGGTADPTREAVVAALNGVLGDHLAATGNPLATTMALRMDGHALQLQPAALAARLQQARPTLLLMVHGLCMNDLQWRRDGHDHGAALAPVLDATPLYLHYNSGLPIADNGRRLASLLQGLTDAWPAPQPRIVVLAHSMGGLVVRSALHQAAQAGCSWPALVHDVVFLGTPHQGAPLERAGHGLDVLLAALPYAAPLARLARVRSAGITDLRHGRVMPGPAQVPLPAGPRWWTIAARLGTDAAAMKGRLLGDGLVPVDSALGRHAQAARALHFEPARQCVLTGLNHMQLLGDPAVAQQLHTWLAPSAAAPDRLELQGR